MIAKNGKRPGVNCLWNCAMFNTRLLINGNFSIKDALARLDEVVEKVLFIVDNENKLIGAMTDGDVRRYLLSGKGLEGDIANIYNNSPKFLYAKDLSQDDVKNLFFDPVSVMLRKPVDALIRAEEQKEGKECCHDALTLTAPFPRVKTVLAASGTASTRKK